MPQAVERTQAVAAFFRDGSVSSSDSVMVIVALALDTPRLSPLITAWEKEAAVPEAAPDEVVFPQHGTQGTPVVWGKFKVVVYLLYPSLPLACPLKPLVPKHLRLVNIISSVENDSKGIIGGGKNDL